MALQPLNVRGFMIVHNNFGFQANGIALSNVAFEGIIRALFGTSSHLLILPKAT